MKWAVSTWGNTITAHASCRAACSWGRSPGCPQVAIATVARLTRSCAARVSASSRPGEAQPATMVTTATQAAVAVVPRQEIGRAIVAS